MDCRSGARGRLFAPAPRGPGGVLPTRAPLLSTTDRKLPGPLPRPPRPCNVGVARSSFPVDRQLEGYHHDQASRQLQRRPGPRRREVVPLGVPRHEAGRGPRQRARRQPRGGPRRPVLPGRGGHPGRRRPGPKHRLPGHQARQARRASRSLTCPESQPTGPRSCSPETSRPTSATPW